MLMTPYNQLVPWVAVAVVFQGVPNADLSSVDPLSTAVLSVGDGNGHHPVHHHEVNSPPGVRLEPGVGT